MEEGAMENETALRLGSFLCVFSIIGVGEVLVPRRTPTTSKARRWSSNLGIVALNPISVRLAFPLLPTGMAVLAQERHWGILNSLDFPYWLAAAIGFMAMDFFIYLQHILFHAVPLLWRLHMVHHADLAFDLTTGLVPRNIAYFV